MTTAALSPEPVACSRRATAGSAGHAQRIRRPTAATNGLHLSNVQMAAARARRAHRLGPCTSSMTSLLVR
ncbi:MAG: hypothetical protein GEU98_26335 [Pseudonocardiaceae bacterium]|nr:hypothetical protein [Pseudonocardiaceae bacterium]